MTDHDYPPSERKTSFDRFGDPDPPKGPMRSTLIGLAFICAMVWFIAWALIR